MLRRWQIPACLIVSCLAFSQQLPPLPEKLPGTMTIPHLTKGPVSIVKPVYPEEARKQWLDGTVVLDAVISVNGDVEQIGCDHLCLLARPDFVRAAADAVRQWHWDPVIVKGKPVRVRTRVEVPFRLDEQTPPISICTVLKDPKHFMDRVANVYGTVTVLDRRKFLGSTDCEGTLGLLDDSELTPPMKDSKYVAFQEASSIGAAPVAVRGLIREDKSPGYHPILLMTLERVLRNGN